MFAPLRLLALSALLSVCALAADVSLPPVAPVDLSKLKPSDFTDDELDLPFYLAHFPEVANGMDESGPTRGYLRLSVWRGGTAAPHNARGMENILSLAYWFTLERPWNPYRGDPAVRARLEAAFTYWCDLQSDDGQFPEYAPQRWNLAATAFATKFCGEALLLLNRPGAPAIDPAVKARAEEALRRAINATLVLPDLYEHGKSYTNQFGNVWGGGLAYFSFRPDAALRAQWEKRFHESRAEFQSPAGYYYERDGPDFGYTTSTHDHNSRQAWEWLRGTALGEELVAKERAWFEWLAHNAAPEPDFSGFVYNRAIETRQRHASFARYDTPLGEFIPLVRAFAESHEERSARWQRERAELEKNWPRVPALRVGDFWAYSPYVFLHRRLNEWRPTTAERDAARPLLPMLARAEFAREFVDGRKNVVFLFVRRPGYYAAFNAGEKIHEQQRYGLGLVWTPALGAVLQSQTGSDVAAWGTRAAGATRVNEAVSLPRTAGRPGVRDLPAGEVSASYALLGGGTKGVHFGRERIAVSVAHPGAFSEELPLLVPPDGRVEIEKDRVVLRSPRGEFVVRFDEGVQPALADAPGTVLAKRIVVLTLSAREKMRYALEVPSKR